MEKNKCGTFQVDDKAGLEKGLLETGGYWMCCR